MSAYLKVSIACVLALASLAAADVVEYEGNKDEWIAAVGQYTTLDFTGFPSFTIITDQYADKGVLFVGGDDWVLEGNPNTFPEDGSGIRSDPCVHLQFFEPQNWIAADFPGTLDILLFHEGELIYESSLLGFGGPGNFGGLISTEGFDEALLEDTIVPPVFIDNIHFGAPQLPGDVNDDGVIDVEDLIAVILGWGPCPEEGMCAADVTGDDVVDVEDLVVVILHWW